MNKTTEALKLAEEALSKLDKAAFNVVTAQNQTEAGITVRVLNTELQGSRKALAAIREALADQFRDATKMIAESKCSDHPDAPHGFDRNGSHNAGRYVCDCEGWSPEPVKQETEEYHVENVYVRGDKYFAWIGKDYVQIFTAPVDAKAIRAEAFKEAAEWCEAKQSYNAMHANTEFAAGIRGLK